MTGYQKLKRKYEIEKENNQIFKTALKKIAAMNCPDNVFAKKTATEALLNEKEQETD